MPGYLLPLQPNGKERSININKNLFLLMVALGKESSLNLVGQISDNSRLAKKIEYIWNDDSFIYMTYMVFS